MGYITPEQAYTKDSSKYFVQNSYKGEKVWCVCQKNNLYKEYVGIRRRVQRKLAQDVTSNDAETLIKYPNHYSMPEWLSEFHLMVNGISDYMMTMPKDERNLSRIYMNAESFVYYRGDAGLAFMCDQQARAEIVTALLS